MKANNLTLIDYIAQEINNQKAKAQGYISAPRWLCTSDEIREECLKEATKKFDEWKADELQAEINRNNYRGGIKTPNP